MSGRYSCEARLCSVHQQDGGWAGTCRDAGGLVGRRARWAGRRLFISINNSNNTAVPSHIISSSHTHTSQHRQQQMSKLSHTTNTRVAIHTSTGLARSFPSRHLPPALFHLLLLKVRLHFAAGYTTGWTKRFEDSHTHTHTRLTAFCPGLPG